MIEEYTLEEDLPVEFRDSTLQISDNKLESPSRTSTVAAALSDNTTDINAIKNNTSNDITSNDKSYWGSNIITPLTKFSVSFWGGGQKSTQQENAIEKSTRVVVDDPNNFFTFRDGVIERAMNDCKDQFLDETSDGPLIAAFLLTQINHWNSDKERLVLLTKHSLVIAKYDFIALKRLNYRKLALESIDEILIGDLIYPTGSLIPGLNGFVDGLSNILETCLFNTNKWTKSDNNKHITSFYQPRNRNMRGVRLVWNREDKANFGNQWNPFNDDIPFATFTFHPLYFNQDCANDTLKNVHNLDLFVEQLTSAIKELDASKCLITNRDILLENYVGIGSVIHNRNSLGFFKVRGKFSF